MRWKGDILVLKLSTLGAIPYTLLKQEVSVIQTVLNFYAQYSSPLQVFLSENIIIAVHELAHALQNPPQKALFSNIGDYEMVVIDQLSDISFKVAENLHQSLDPPHKQNVTK